MTRLELASAYAHKGHNLAPLSNSDASTIPLLIIHLFYQEVLFLTSPV